MDQNRIAVVTGANRGIGFEICRQLAQQDVHSRDQIKGRAARDRLVVLGLEVDKDRNISRKGPPRRR